MLGLVSIGKGTELVHEAPGEPAREVGPQPEARGRRIAGGEHPRPAFARLVDRHEEHVLGVLIERLNVVGDDQLGIRTCRGGKQMAAAAAARSPEINNAFLERLRRERPHACERFAIGAGHEVGEILLARRRSRKG